MAIRVVNKKVRRSKRSKRGSSVLKGAGITVVAGTALYTSPTASGFIKINLHPANIATRTLDASNSYSSYRFTKLRFSALPSGSQLSILAYTDKPESVSATAVTTALQFAELPCAVINPSSCTNVRSMRVPRVFLRGNYEWYNCNTGTDLTGTAMGGISPGTLNVLELTIQGQILLWQGLASPNNYWIEYECEFRDPSFGDSSPAPIIPRYLSSMSEGALLDELARRRADKHSDSDTELGPPSDSRRHVLAGLPVGDNPRYGGAR